MRFIGNSFDYNSTYLCSVQRIAEVPIGRYEEVTALRNLTRSLEVGKESIKCDYLLINTN